MTLQIFSNNKTTSRKKNKEHPLFQTKNFRRNHKMFKQNIKHLIFHPFCQQAKFSHSSNISVNKEGRGSRSDGLQSGCNPKSVLIEG